MAVAVEEWVFMSDGAPSQLSGAALMLHRRLFSDEWSSEIR